MRLRIPIGSISTTDVLPYLIMLAVLAVIAAAPAHAAEAVVLPCYDEGGFVTDIRYTNPTAANLVLDSGAQVSPAVGEILPAKSSVLKRVRCNGGVIQIIVPAGIVATAELTSPSGGFLVAEPLKPIRAGVAYGLRNGGGYNSGVVLTALEETAVLVNGALVYLAPNAPKIVPASGESVAITTNLGFNLEGKAPVYALVYVNHRNGALTAVPVQ